MRFVSTVIEKLLKSLSKGTRKVAEVALFTPFQSKTTAQREKKKKKERVKRVLRKRSTQTEAIFMQGFFKETNRSKLYTSKCCQQMKGTKKGEGINQQFIIGIKRGREQRKKLF